MRIGDPVRIVRGQFKDQTGVVISCKSQHGAAHMRVRHSLPPIWKGAGRDDREGQTADNWFSSRSLALATRLGSP